MWSRDAGFQHQFRWCLNYYSAAARSQTRTLGILTIMVCLGVVDQLIRLATNAPVRKSISLIASCPLSSFEALTCALGYDSPNRKPLSDRLLGAAASRLSRSELVQEMRQDVIQLTDVFIDGGRWSTKQLWLTQGALERRRIDRTDVVWYVRNDRPWYAYNHVGNNQTVVGYVVDIYDLDVGHESLATGSDDVEKIGDTRHTPGGFVHQLCQVEWLEAVSQLLVNWRVVSCWISLWVLLFVIWASNLRILIRLILMYTCDV